MNNIFIVKLSNEFYLKHDNDVEILKKKDRPYAQGTLISDVANIYFIPFRTNLPQKALKRFPEDYIELPTLSKPYAGLDITKTIILTEPEEVRLLPRAYVDNNQYKLLMRKKQELEKKVLDYVQGYKRLIKDKKGIKDKYQFTTLRYFHKELGLPELKNKQLRNYRDTNFIAAPKTDKAPGFDRGL